MTADGVPAAASPAHERAAYVLLAAALLFAFRYHLVSGLVAGLLVHTLLQRTARLLHGPRLSHGAARVVAAGLFALLASGATFGAVVALAAFVRGHLGDLPGVFEKMADVIDRARDQLSAWGVGTGALASFETAEQIKEASSLWLRTHASQLTKVGGEAGRTALHIAMGIVVGLLVFFRREAEGAPRPFAAALAGRVSRFAASFERVVLAQLEISAINTALTAVYLLALLPLAGVKLPFSGTLVLITFVTGLLPVVGNLLSNTVIVVLSFGVAPWLALVSLGFLVGVHKLEYVVNAKIVGNRIGAQAWEILLAIVVFEVAFGVPGVVLAPIVYAYAKGELRERGLV